MTKFQQTIGTEAFSTGYKKFAWEVEWLSKRQETLQENKESKRRQDG